MIKDLYNYQKEVIFFLQTASYTFLFDEMGLGKSVMVLEAFPQNVLYVGTKASLLSFKSEIKKWYPDKKIDFIKTGYNGSADFYLVNYHSKAISEIINVGKKIQAIVLDEVHILKNKNTKLFKTWKYILSQIKEFNFYAKPILLSATPIVNDRKELDNYYDLVGDENFFKNQPLNPFERNYANMIRREKHEIKELKFPKIHITCFVFQKPEQYNTLMEQWDNYKNYYTKEKILLVSPTLFNVKKETEEDRIDAVLKLLKDIKGKTIIYSQYVKTLELLNKYLHTDIIYGKISMKKREEIIEKFKKENDILLATIKTGGEGLNLQEAKNVIFLDLWWTYASFIQAINRLRRVNSKYEEINAYFFFTPKTVDELIIKTIIEKKKKLEYVNYNAFKFI